MPEFIGYYLAQADKELKLKQVSKLTTAWVKRWSEELADITFQPTRPSRGVTFSSNAPM